MISHHLPLAINFKLTGKVFPKQTVVWSEGKEIIDKPEIRNVHSNAGMGGERVDN